MKTLSSISTIRGAWGGQPGRAHELDEGGADRLGVIWYRKRPLARPTAPKILRRRLLPGVITCWRVHAPSRWPAPRAAARGRVSSSANTTAPSGGAARVGPDVGDDLVGVGGVLGDQLGLPGCDLADPPVQAAQAHGRAAQLQAQQRNRPGTAAESSRLWVGQAAADPPTQPPAAQARPPNAGPIGEPADSLLVVALDPAAHRPWVAAQQLGDPGRRPVLLGEQDHDQPVADPVRPCSTPSGL
jgi:hypothetical protein